MGGATPKLDEADVEQPSECAVYRPLTPEDSRAAGSPADQERRPRRGHVRASSAGEQRLSGDALRALLAPTTAEAFIDEHWNVLPLFVRGSAEKAAALLGRPPGPREREGFFREIGALVASGKVIVHASLPHGEWLAGRAPVRPYVTVGVDAIDAVLSGGASIQVSGLEHLASDGPYGGIARLARQLVADIGLYGDVGVALTISPPGARFDPHLDPGGAAIVQVAGKKRYAFGPSELDHPPHKGFVGRGGKVFFGSDHRALLDVPDDDRVTHDPAALTERVLEPGDLLYLPAGGVHATLAIEESWGLLYMFMETSFGGVVDGLVARAFGHERSWRYVPPCGPGRALPAATRAFIGERLRELKALVASLEEDDVELAAVIQGHIARSSAAPRVAPDPAATAAPPAREAREAREAADPTIVAPDDASVRWSTGRGPEGPATVMSRGSLEVRLDGAWADWILRVRDEGPVPAGVAASWAPDAEQALACLAELCDRGILARR